MKHKITCKGCKSRYLGCHEECADYIAYRKEKDELNELRYETQKEREVVDGYRMKSQTKFEKRQGKFKK